MTLLEQSEGSRVVFNSKGNLQFLDLNIIVSQGRGVTCYLYQKPTDTETTLNYRSCAPIQYKRSVI